MIKKIVKVVALGVVILLISGIIMGPQEPVVEPVVVKPTEVKKTPVVKPKPVEVDKTRILKQFRRCDMDKTLEKLQRLLFAIGSRFNHMIFEKVGNKVQDCRNAIKEVF